MTGRSYHRSTFLIVAVAMLLIPLVATAQQKRSDQELRRRGRAAYEELPRVVGLEHAPLFADAVRYFFAYEQRTYRNGDRPQGDFMEAMNWLSDGLEGFKVGKGDAAGRHRGDEQLRRKGLTTYEDTKASEEGGVIWDVEAYISASANLYAYLQVAASPRHDARNAFVWLQRHRGRLVVAGGKGDRLENPMSWAPSTPKPGTQPIVTPVLPDEARMRLDAHPLVESPEVDPQSVDRQALVEDLAEQHQKRKDELEYSILKARYERLKAELVKVKSRLDALAAQGGGETLGTEAERAVDVILADIGDNKIAVIKAVRSITGRGLKESKRLVDGAPTPIAEAVTEEQAKKMKVKLEKAGARVALRPSKPQ